MLQHLRSIGFEEINDSNRPAIKRLLIRIFKADFDAESVKSVENNTFDFRKRFRHALARRTKTGFLILCDWRLDIGTDVSFEFISDVQLPSFIIRHQSIRYPEGGSFSVSRLLSTLNMTVYIDSKSEPAEYTSEFSLLFSKINNKNLAVHSHGDILTINWPLDRGMTNFVLINELLKFLESR